MPNPSGHWDTTAIPDGSYNVSVELSDFAGNTRVRTVRACVQNGGGCTTELAIRDADDDNGAIPYTGPNWWQSPDITVNPGTSDENRNVNLGRINPIRVRVWNLSGLRTAGRHALYRLRGLGPPVEFGPPPAAPRPVDRVPHGDRPLGRLGGRFEPRDDD